MLVDWRRNNQQFPRNQQNQQKPMKLAIPTKPAKPAKPVKWYLISAKARPGQWDRCSARGRAREKIPKIKAAKEQTISSRKTSKDKLKKKTKNSEAGKIPPRSLGKIPLSLERTQPLTGRRCVFLCDSCRALRILVSVRLARQLWPAAISAHLPAARASTWG